MNLNGEESKVIYASNLKGVVRMIGFVSNQTCQQLRPTFQTKNVLCFLKFSYELLNVFKSLLLPFLKLMPVKWLWLVNIQILLETLYLPFSNNKTLIPLCTKAPSLDPFLGLERTSWILLVWTQDGQQHKWLCGVLLCGILEYTEAGTKQIMQHN